MTAYKHILVALDLTDESQQVLRKARDQAALHKAHLSFVHVVPALAQVYGGFSAMGMVGDASGQLVNFEREALSQSQRQLIALVGTDEAAGPRTHVLVGRAALEIQRVAQEIGADLIVIGTHGQHGFGLLLGSTANAVLHGVTVDVLVVRVKVPTVDR